MHEDEVRDRMADDILRELRELRAEIRQRDEKGVELAILRADLGRVNARLKEIFLAAAAVAGRVTRRKRKRLRARKKACACGQLSES
jgi:hypothetical protein